MTEHYEFYKPMQECTYEFFGIQTETCQEGAPTKVLDPGRSLKVFEYLGGEIVQSRAQDR